MTQLADDVKLEGAHWNVHSKVEKFRSEADRLAGAEPYEVLEFEENLLLNEGITRLLNLLVGGGGTAYNNANARIGVGSGNAAAVATQTALQGGSSLFKGQDGGFPTVTGQSVQFRATFTDAEANFAWEEWTVDNGVTANENLNRKVAAMGTKASGSWTLTVTITLS